ncbi:MAG: hypothetical protein PHW64_00235 [Sulfuricurvum sp.]|nr:hypothetical protein [Sulfuricurvum sp.]
MKKVQVFFSFFNRFRTEKSLTENLPKLLHDDTVSPQKLFGTIAEQHDGTFYEDFLLFHQDTSTAIDLLLFIPERGIFIGEKVVWTPNDLEGASIERSSKRSKKTPSTHLEKREWRIHQKLQDVLSFDSTPIIRFFWFPYLTEDGFDRLDSSFHQLLPKNHLIFRDTPQEAILSKFASLAPLKHEPYSKVKIIGSLLSHTLLLPTKSDPFGKILSEEQIKFLETPLHSPLTQLCGDYGSGKSTLLLRKALQILLTNRLEKIIIITPTRLGGELMRNELVSLIEYGVLDVNLGSFFFHIPEQIDNSDFQKHLQESTLIICDDADQLENSLIERLMHHDENRLFLLSSLEPIMSSCNTKLINHYRYDARHYLFNCSENTLLSTLLTDLRKRLADTPSSEIIVVFENYATLNEYKVMINEYLQLSCQILIPSFSLQYQDFDSLILTIPECLCGISIPHLYFISSGSVDNYPFILSRASESVTIITYSKS